MHKKTNVETCCALFFVRINGGSLQGKSWVRLVPFTQRRVRQTTPVTLGAVTTRRIADRRSPGPRGKAAEAPLLSFVHLADLCAAAARLLRPRGALHALGFVHDGQSVSELVQRVHSIPFLFYDCFHGHCFYFIFLTDLLVLMQVNASD